MLNFKQYFCSPFFKIFILFFYFSVISSAYAQTDSLAGKSFEELRTANLETINRKPETTILYMTAAFRVAEKENSASKMAYALSEMADAKSLLSKNNEALQDLERAIRLVEKSNDNTSLFNFYNLKGIIATEMGEYLKALDAYMKSKEYAVLDKSIANEVAASINIGFIKKLNQDYEEAISIFKKNLEKLKEIDMSLAFKNSYKLFLYINVTDSYLRLKELGSTEYIKEAEYYNKLGLQICSKVTNTDDYYTLLLNEVIILFEKKEYAKSIKLASDIQEYAISVNDEALLGTTYFYIGKNYHFQDKHKEAIVYLEKFYEIIKKSEKEYSNERQLHGLLDRSYSVERQSEKSKFHYKEHERLLEKERKESVKVVAAIHDLNDLPETTKQLEDISEEFKVQEKRKKWLYGISSLLIISLIGSIIFYRFKVKRIKKRVVEVLQQVTVLEQLQQEKQEKKKINSTVASISEKVTDAKAALLLEKLEKFEEKEEFLSLDCSLGYVAEKLRSNTSYVSNVINNYKNKTFKSYITELRINAALIRLKNDEKLRSYTIQAIAEEFGFKRQETFSKAFKSQTSIYPSQYLKKLRKDKEIH